MKQTPVSFGDVARYVWSYFRRFPFMVGGVYLALTINVVAEVMNPVVLGWLTDAITISNVPLDQRFQHVAFFVLLMVGQGLLFHISYRTAHFLNCYTDSKVQSLVGIEALDRVQRFSDRWHVNAFAGAIVTKIKRAMNGVHAFGDIIAYRFYRTLAITVIMIVLIYIKQPILGIIFGGFSILYAVYSILIASRYVAPINRKANEADNKLGGVLADTLSSNQTVKSFAGEDREVHNFRHIATAWMRIVRLSWVRGNIATLSQNLIINIFLKLLVMGGAVWYWSQGVFTPGDVVFIFTSYQIFSGYLSDLGDQVERFTQAINDTEDVVRFFKTPIEVKDISRAKNLEIPQGKIEFKNVSFRYPEQKATAYQDFSLTIKPKEKVALVGHSGSGKSTFVKLLQRLYDVKKGQIFIDGQDISKVTQESLRANVGLVPQDPILFHRTLRENISYGKPKASQEEIEKSAHVAHAHEFISTLSKQYDTLVGERGIKLSGGERQRVAIARAVLADCPILIFDEATSSLDSESEKYIQDALHHLIEDRTAIIIAHRLSTIKFVDRILVFEDGAVVEEGTHAQLIRRKNGIYRKLYELQAGGFLQE